MQPHCAILIGVGKCLLGLSDYAATGSGIDNFGSSSKSDLFLQHPSFDTCCENFKQYSWNNVRVVLFQKNKDFFPLEQQFAPSQSLSGSLTCLDVEG